MPRILLLLFCFFYSFASSAQKSLIFQSPNPIESIDFIDLPKLNNSLLKKEVANKEFGAMTFAKEIMKTLDCNIHGTWESLSNGKMLWKLRIRSEGAASLNIVFHKYLLPNSSTLLIYNSDQSYVVGPFTNYDNNNHGKLWSPIIPYDDIILELQIPAEQIKYLQLQIGQINHGFLDHLSKSFSASCHLDVICGVNDGYSQVEKYRDVIRSVGIYSIEGTRLCTGALVNNTRNDCTPYFLTANHCGINAANAASVVIHWNYENQTCREPSSFESGNPGDGSLLLFNSGTRLISKNASSDFALIELERDVPSEANAFFAGWNITGINTDTSVCIHHPNVEEKRISFDYNRLEIYPDDPLFWIVNNWEIGSTESGSSGAPIFNSNNEIIGQIFGGQASCSNNLWDIFGRLDVSWAGNGQSSGRLSDWLDPLQSGVTSIGGKSCSALLAINEPIVRVCNTTSNSHSIILSVNDGFADQANLQFENSEPGISITLEKNMINVNTTSIVNIAVSDQVADGDYHIKFIAEDNSNSAIAFLTVRVSKILPNAILSISPVSTNTVGTNIDFEWENDYEFYDIEVADNEIFTTTLGASLMLNSNIYSLSGLAQETKFYWRVRGINACGTGIWNVFEFETGEIKCTTYLASDLPIVIEEAESNTVISRINILSNEVITDINILKVKGIHSWLGDLQFRLISPSGTEVILLSEECDDSRNFDLGFDDESSIAVLSCPYNDEILYKPLNPLSVFKDESSQGIWQLQILDLEDFDGGSFTDWTLEICTNISRTISSTEDLVEDVITTYPNPTGDILFVKRKQNIKFPNYSIHDLRGVEIISGDLDQSINVGQLSNGIYFLQIKDGNKLLGIKKLVISK